MASQVAPVEPDRATGDEGLEAPRAPARAGVARQQEELAGAGFQPELGGAPEDRQIAVAAPDRR